MRCPIALLIAVPVLLVPLLDASASSASIEAAARPLVEAMLWFHDRLVSVLLVLVTFVFMAIGVGSWFGRFNWQWLVSVMGSLLLLVLSLSAVVYFVLGSSTAAPGPGPGSLPGGAPGCGRSGGFACLGTSPAGFLGRPDGARGPLRISEEEALDHQEEYAFRLWDHFGEDLSESQRRAARDAFNHAVADLRTDEEVRYGYFGDYYYALACPRGARIEECAVMSHVQLP